MSSNWLTHLYDMGVPAPPKKTRKKIAPQWYWVTRTLGSFMILYGMLFDISPERGTLIITGAGLVGIDKVVRVESPPKD